MPRLSLMLGSLMCCLPTLLAAHGKAHEHGRGQLDVAVEGTVLSVALTLPADSVVGFEHAVRNAEQRATVDAAAAWLAQLPLQLGLPANAACTPARVAVEVPTTQRAQAPAGDRGHAHHDHHHGKSEVDAHADWQIDLELVCAGIRDVGSLDFGPLFQRFPKLERLDVQRLDAAGQNAARLQPATSRLALSTR